jgi:hypothetical protein
MGRDLDIDGSIIFKWMDARQFSLSELWNFGLRNNIRVGNQLMEGDPDSSVPSPECHDVTVFLIAVAK